MIDLTELLNPISTGQPCGVQLDIGDPAYLKLQQEIDAPAKTASSWGGIESQSVSILKRSKDLQIVMYLIRALIRTEGLAGFYEGLKLLQQMLETYWDTLYPKLDLSDDEPAFVRRNKIAELNDFDLVRNPLRTDIALVESRQLGRFSCRDIEIATDQCKLPDGMVKPDSAVIQAAFDQERAAVKTTFGLLDNCLSVINAIASSYSEFNLKEITAQLQQMKNTVSTFSPNLEQTEPIEQDATDSVVPTTKAKPQLGAIESRDDVLNAIDRICAYYQQKEPSSPVPILLQRAKKLVKADFNEIVQNLLPDAMRQLEVHKGPEPTDK